MNSALKSDPLYAADAQSPADVLVAEEMGRVNRSTPGDANNDGYNEAAGAYELLATGPRLELKLSPRAVPIVRPVLEISGMPPGKVLVTVEGRLIDQTSRLDDGRLLLELPVRIDRPTIINVRIE